MALGGYHDADIQYKKGLLRKFIGSVPAPGGMPRTAPIEKVFNKGKVEIEKMPQVYPGRKDTGWSRRAEKGKEKKQSTAKNSS